MEYGYARVSTKEQNEQRQIVALEEFGLDRKRPQTEGGRYPCGQEHRPSGAEL